MEKRQVIALDTEDTGLDLRHGARPFFVTITKDDGEQLFWEWDVDPLTRAVTIPEEDREAILEQLLLADELILHNAKFDVTALHVSGIAATWNWNITRDTLIAAHLLASNRPKDLTSLAIEYLGINIEPHEKALEKAVQEARRYCRSHLKDWAIAKEGRPDMPSAKEKTWKYDCWLPRALRREDHCPDKPEWDTVLAEYANPDSETTLLLWKAMESEIKRLGLWEIYLERMKVIPVAWKMEQRGVTVSRQRLEQLTDEYREESEKAANLCVGIAASYEWDCPECVPTSADTAKAVYDHKKKPAVLFACAKCDGKRKMPYELELPKGAVNNSLRTFCFDVMKLPPIRNPKAKTDAPCLDSKNAIPHYLATLDPKSKPHLFIKTLTGKRSRDTALAYMEGYRKFWLPCLEDTTQRWRRADDPGNWFRLHPSLNPTGTDTLRWSSNNPNEQNISKKEGFNLRYAFGPSPGREWWSLDAKNIELRIPAYESGETAFIELFERPDDPPYFGSNHLLIAHLLFPREFEACRNEQGEIDGRIFKKKYASTAYQRVKNGNFAVQYGAVDREDGMGTADRTYGIKGAQARIKAKFRKQEELNQHWIRFAEKHGYVETMPDKTVNPKRGYPLLCARTDWGRVLPTVPLNYHVQGTAMWWMQKAMVRVQAKLDEWRNKDGFDGYLVMQVHDELVLDFPLKKDRGNLPRVRTIKSLMEQGGADLGLPTPVSIEYHPDNWSEGITL